MKNRKTKGIAALVLAVVMSLTPVSVFATQTGSGETAQPTANDIRYAMPIESNAIENWPQGPAVYGKSAMVMDVDTGAVLYEKNVDEQLYPASITKIMTTLIACEKCDLDERVTFSNYAINSLEWGCSRVGIRVGETISVRQCLYSMMLASANECCIGIAEHIAGSEEDFVAMMNERAKELGCTNTHFNNTNGMPDEKHLTTAHDMALIAAAAYKNPTFREITGTTRYHINETNKAGEKRYMTQHHKMMLEKSEYYYENCVGGKTGYTEAALHTLVTYATKGNQTLVAVEMRAGGAGTCYTDTRKLLEYGFNKFSNKEISLGTYKTDDMLFPNFLWDIRDITIPCEENQKVTIPKGFKLSQLQRKTTSEGDVLYRTYTYKDRPMGGMTGVVDPVILGMTDPSSENCRERAAQNEIMSSRKTTASNPITEVTKEIKAPEQVKGLLNWLDTLTNWQKGMILIIIVVIILYFVMLIHSIRRSIRRRKNRKRRAKRRAEEAARKQKK